MYYVCFEWKTVALFFSFFWFCVWTCSFCACSDSHSMYVPQAQQNSLQSGLLHRATNYIPGSAICSCRPLCSNACKQTRRGSQVSSRAIVYECFTFQFFLFVDIFWIMRLKNFVTPPTINLLFPKYRWPLTLSSVIGRRLDYGSLEYRCDWRDQKQPSLCCHFNHMFHAAACCVFKHIFPPIDIQNT